jgi:dCMP deaminase
MKISWDEYFIDFCKTIQKKSKDPSTKVGCVIVYPDHGICSTGFNGFPRGVLEIPEDYVPFNGYVLGVLQKEYHSKRAENIRQRTENRELKYKFVVHAEANAICNAAKQGHETDGCSIYVPWLPCSRCAGLIVQAGIKEVVLDPEYSNNVELMKRWEEEHKVAKIIFKESKVVVRNMNEGGK